MLVVVFEEWIKWVFVFVLMQQTENILNYTDWLISNQGKVLLFNSNRTQLDLFYILVFSTERKSFCRDQTEQHSCSILHQWRWMLNLSFPYWSGPQQGQSRTGWPSWSRWWRRGAPNPAGPSFCEPNTLKNAVLLNQMIKNINLKRQEMKISRYF